MNGWSSAALRNVLLALLLAAFVVPAPAAAQGVTGAIFGEVVDAGGGRLPGVTVTVTSPQLIRQKETATTDDQGTYRVSNLPPGTYTVTFELAGFQTLRRASIALSAGQSLPIDGQLSISQLEETVTTTGDVPLIDTRNSGLVNVADQQVLKTVPIERQYTKILNIMPGVVDTKYDFTQGNNVHGSSARQNKYALDGLSTDDPWNVITSTDLAVDALQEVQITTAGISAEYGDASGAVFNFVTKSGSNDLHGGANFYYQGENTRASNVSDDLRAQGLTRGLGVDENRDAGVLLGGPILRNRIWFFGNYRNVRYEESKPDFREPLVNNDHQVFAKGTVQVSSANKAELGLHFRDFRNFPYTSTASFANSADSRTWMAVGKTQWFVNPAWTAVLGKTSTLDVRGSIGIFALLASNPNNDGSPAYRDLSTGIISGGDFHAAGDNRRNRHQIKADYTHFRNGWLGGSHMFKTGIGYEITPMWGQRFYQGARGPGELAGCSDACLSATPDTAHLLFNGVPFQVELYNGPVTTRLEMRKWHFYAQDQFVLAERLTLNVGVRGDHSTGNLPATTIGGGRWDPAVDIAATSGVISLTNFSPRFGAVWDVRGDHRSTVKVSAGRFYDALAGSDIDAVSPASLGYRLYDWVDRNGDLVYQPGEETTLRADTRRSLDPDKLPMVDPNLKNQYADVYTFGFERQLASVWAASATLILKREGNFKGIVNSAVPFSSYNAITVTNPLDGQPLQIFTLRPEFLGVPGRNVLTNPGERPGDTEPLRRRYNGLELVMKRQMRDRWMFQGSYVLGDGKGNVPNNFGGSGSVNYTNPNRLVNRYGDVIVGPRHQVKLSGAWDGPHGIAVSGYFEHLSGNPLTDDFGGFGANQLGAPVVRIYQTNFPQILTEPFIDVTGAPVGSAKMDAQNRFDLRLEKRFAFKDHTFSIAGDIFNLFNAGTVIRVQNIRLDAPNYMRPADLQLPRQLRIGLRWEF